ncbi:MAG: ABC transporter permease, partial [Planctomycetota bacterium]|nr:ABC transporter permease [Planctomycetota bacterium]
MLSYVWRNLLTRKIRTGLSMLGVAVSVAAIVALISVAYGMRTSIDAYMEEGGASLIVFSGNVADLIFSSVSHDEVDEVQRLPGVEHVSRTHFFMVKPPKDDEREVSVPMVLCFGRYPGERLLERFKDRITAGDVFSARDEIVVSKYIADTLGWSIGKNVELFPGQLFKVVGLYESKISWENGGLMMDAAVLGEKLGRDDSHNLVFVYCTPGAEDASAQAIEAKFPHLKAIPPGEFTESFSEQLAIMDEFIAMITVIALVVGVLGVLNTMMMSVHERTREI